VGWPLTAVRVSKARGAHTAPPPAAPCLSPSKVIQLELALLAEDDVEPRHDEEVALELRDDLVAHAVAEVELGLAAVLVQSRLRPSRIAPG